MKKIFGMASFLAIFMTVMVFLGCSNGSDSQSVVATTPQTPATVPDGYKKVGEVTIGSTTYDLVTFGLWPQTIKADSVTVDENVTEIHGAFTYCKGSDGEWYVKQMEKACMSGYKYSDGTTAAQSSVNSEKWFKVEPIKWRVLTTNYGGNKLLLAESILTSGVQYYLDENIRTINGNTIHPNNYKYSTIRAYLNGSYESDDTQDATYSEKGFLQSAFTCKQQAAIKTNTVDNSAASTIAASGSDIEINKATMYTCANTSDKIFLLSVQEATTDSFGFVPFIRKNDPTRMHFVTDFAKATGSWLVSIEDICGCWLLRSPHYPGYDGSPGFYVRDVYKDGNMGSWDRVDNTACVGIVPALCVE